MHNENGWIFGVTDFLTSAQMRAIEQAAIESGAVSGAELMDRAGRGAVEMVFATWPDLAEAPAIAFVLCGPGNNGGDGYVMARLLRAQGWHVRIAQFGPDEPVTPDARMNFHKAQVAGCAVAQISGQLALEIFAQAGSVLVIDALFGTGVTRALPPELRALSHLLEDGAQKARRDVAWAAPRFMAVDLPSGLCADTGQVLGEPEGGRAFMADLTVTFHGLKHGHVRASGPALCGLVRVVDIGLWPWDELRHGV
ncbi:MAG: NAD(P)H-hydrate epimerase [Rhodobacteraceae bacterium]|nr:MAG: NAD(P)H-hydrate epimerase [Paracoccaceae bacterium]